MDRNLQSSPKLGNPVDSGDIKYVSGLSTILVATIQEAKDRISQIEYMFCCQLYPNFQSKSKSLQKIYSEAKQEAEDAWNEKEKDLLLQIEKLKLEKERALEEIQSLKLEKEKSMGDADMKANSLLAKGQHQQTRIDELEWELMQKSKEVDEGMELQGKLLQLVQTKSSIIVEKGKQLRECEEKTNRLLAKVKCLEEKVEELQMELIGETQEVAKKKKLEKDLLRKIDFLLSDVADRVKLLAEQEEEKKNLISKLNCLEENVSKLEKKLVKKTQEIEEARVLQAQLLQQIDMNAAEVVKQNQQLEESENDKKVLLDRVNGLEDKVKELEENLGSGRKVVEETDSYENLLKKMEAKDYELLAEKKKRRDVVDSYKRLKSQYNFLRTKFGLTAEFPQNKLQNESGSLKHEQNPTISPDIVNKNLDTSTAACELNKVKIENEFNDGLEDDKLVKEIPIRNFHSPTSINIASKCTPTVKSTNIIGAKRPASCWIDTRSRQCKDGPDPHDDFLNTPFENLREKLNKNIGEEIPIPHVPVQKDMNTYSSDDETQDMNVDPSPEKMQMPVPMASRRGFKYVEPVRKKAERENLKGVECKQCKKFYDAVLPNNGGKDADGNKQSFRCEHHDGVSRHRYKYIPPMTPEGFWNIGFESEL